MQVSLVEFKNELSLDFTFSLTNRSNLGERTTDRGSRPGTNQSLQREGGEQVRNKFLQLLHLKSSHVFPYFMLDVLERLL